MCQYRLIHFNKCTTLIRDVNNGEGYAHVGTGVYGKSLYLSLNFAVNLKLLKKIKSQKKEGMVKIDQ